MGDVTVQGWDISLNHGAMVELDNGELTDFLYYTDKAGGASRSKEHGVRLVMSKSPDPKIRETLRLFSLEEIFSTWLKRTTPGYVVVEDYALGASMRAHQIGEVGGLARMVILNHEANLRLHDPKSVKMFVAHNGNAPKELMEETVGERWGHDFGKYNPLPKGKKPSRTTSEDLADALGLAHMGWTEIRVRSGALLLSELHEKEVRVFNRISKSNPVNLLDREWIQR